MMKLTTSVLTFALATVGFAEPRTLTVATIIPDGTPGAKALKDFSKSVETESKGEIIFKFKWGGNGGSDKEVLARMKSGDLQGAMFAGQIMDQVLPAVRTAEIPFQFGKDRGKARSYIDSQKEAWSKKLDTAGFHALAFYDVGFVYLCGTKPVNVISDIKDGKVWLWPGDKLGQTVITQLGAKPVEIEVKDTFKALSDGRLDFAYAPAIAIVALQWYSKAKFVGSDPISYAAGTFLLSDAAWKKLSPAEQSLVAKTSKSLSAKLNDANAADEKEALEAMSSMGVTMTPIKSSETDKIQSISKAVSKAWRP